MMTAFDKECPRCKTLGKQTLPAAPAPPAPALPSPLPNVPAAAPQSPALMPSSVLPGEALACPVCGNQATQKVTAICESGTWTTQARGYTAMIGSDGQGHTLMAGGPTITSSLSQTGLANRLMPPPRPVAPGFSLGLALLMIALGIGSLVALVSGIANYWDIATLFIALVLCGAAVVVGYAEARRAARDQQLLLLLLPLWESARVMWNRTFYCGRCDHAYDPQTRAYVPAGEMRRLLPPIQVNAAQLPAQESHSTRLAVAGGIGAVLFLTAAFLAGRAEHAADANAFSAVKAPLVAQYHKLAARADAATQQANQVYHANQTTGALADYGSAEYDRQSKVSALGDAITSLHSSQSAVQSDLQSWEDSGSSADALKDHAQQVNTEMGDLQAKLDALSSAAQAVGPGASPMTLAAPAVVMRTRAGGGDTSQFSAAGSNVNLPPVTLQPAPASSMGTSN